MTCNTPAGLRTWLSCIHTAGLSGQLVLENSELPGGPVVRTWCSPCGGPGFDPWSGNKDPASCWVWPKRKIVTDQHPRRTCLWLLGKTSATSLCSHRISVPPVLQSLCHCAVKTPTFLLILKVLKVKAFFLSSVCLSTLRDQSTVWHTVDSQ